MRVRVMEGFPPPDCKVCVKLRDVLERSFIADGLDRNREER